MGGLFTPPSGRWREEMARVVLEGVSRVFPGGTVAVNDVCLDVKDKEFLVLVGPSGCGKSTTLRIIAGLEEASEGTVCIGDVDVNHLPPKGRDVAMVFQNYALYPHMSVMQNMAFALELRYGVSWIKRFLTRLTRPAKADQWAAKRKEIKQQVTDAARLLGIEHLIDRMPRQLSGGERQRVALGRAIVRRPALFLFDEPLSNLDAKLRVEMRRELKYLHRRLGATMIYVTHDQVEAMTLGDRIAVMSHGSVLQVGSAMEVYENPRNRFVAGFVGSLPMNFVAGKIEVDAGCPQFVGGGCSIPLSEDMAPRSADLAGKPVVLGVRPEEISLDEGEGSRVGRAKVVDVDELGEGRVVSLTWQTENKGEEEDENVLTARLTTRSAPRMGEIVPVSFSPQRCHLFDSESGENLRQAATEQ